MKNNRKALLLLMCAVLMVTASVFGTLAYLTDSEAVTNTFTVGSIGLDLDEAQVTPDGTPVEGAARVKANEYHLLPGGTYTKDPTVHVDPTSESCYVFVKVDNGIADFEAASENAEGGYKNITDQIKANDWKELTDVAGVYYQVFEKGQDDKELEVFQNFKISGIANTVAGWDTITNEGQNRTTVTVTAYAIQLAGFEGKPADAWNAGNQSVADGGWIPATNNG